VTRIEAVLQFKAERQIFWEMCSSSRHAAGVS
jgi:hypothetical protein